MDISGISKVIYIGYAPLTAKTAKDFFISDLIAENLEVEYWDISQYYFGTLTVNNALAEPWIKKVKSLGELKKLLSENGNTPLYFINFQYSALTFSLFRILTKAKVTTCIIARGMLAVPPSSVKRNAKKIIQSGGIKKAYNFGLNKLALLAKKSRIVKPFDKIFFAGNEALKIAGIGYEIDKASAELVPVNSADYDTFLLTRHADRLITDRYAVFIDEYHPFHPDAKMFGLTTAEPDEYFRTLCSYFDRLEKEHNLKIVIAAHPKAELYRVNNYFGGREVIFYKTSELIKDAEFVIMHRSTSVSMAILFNKKMLFVYTDYMKRSMEYFYSGVKYLANLLGEEAINISEVTTNTIDLKVNNELYDRYKYNYLTSKEIQGISSSEIFIKNIKG